MSRTNSTGQNSDDSGASCARGGETGQKRLVNLMFLIIVLLLSLLVLALVVFDQESSAKKNQNRTRVQEKKEPQQGAQYGLSTKDRDRNHSSNQTSDKTDQEPFTQCF